MSRVVVYVKNNCPYCTKAKALFNSKGIVYEEISVENDDKIREELIKKSNGLTTVPQIFVDEVHIGGCDDLYEIYESGKFDEIFGL